MSSLWGIESDTVSYDSGNSPRRHATAFHQPTTLPPPHPLTNLATPHPPRRPFSRRFLATSLLGAGAGLVASAVAVPVSLVSSEA